MPSEGHYLFSGRVHPERYAWQLPFSFKWVTEAESGPVATTVELAASQVSVRFEGDNPGSLLDLKVHASEMARIAVNALGFVSAAGLDVEIATCVEPDGSFRTFNTGFDGLRTVDGAITEEEQAELVQLLTEGLRRGELRHALADLNEAIRAPYDTGFFCFRAVESVRQLYLPEGEADEGQARKTSWEAMRSALGIDKDELGWLTTVAIPRRHGEHRGISEDDRRRALRIARAVVLKHSQVVHVPPEVTVKSGSDQAPPSAGIPT